ncbi:MAG: protein kinase, partial [Pseudomonadota bacterium]
MSMPKPGADEKSTKPLPPPAAVAEKIPPFAQELPAWPPEHPAADTAALTEITKDTPIADMQEGRLHEAEEHVPVEWRRGDVIIGLYEVTDVFTGGATAMVYKVFHRAWNMNLAVKSPKPAILTGTRGVNNFESEAQTWVNLGLHPHIVSCYYVRRLGGIPRLFVEFVDGGDLASWIRKKNLYDGGHETARMRILDIAIQCAWGLQYSHEQGLIHQDVKPANVLMTRDGMAKVTDFGLARARSSAYEEQGQSTVLVTCGGMTPAYCSPEQAEILKQAQAKVPADKRGKLTQLTDIWSWAAMVLEMFTGNITWVHGEHADAGLEEYRAAGTADACIPGMPDELAALLRKCLAHTLSERVQSMEEAAAALQGIYRKVTGHEYSRPAPRIAEALADNLNNRAVSLLDLWQQDEAEQCWSHALKAQPHHPESTYNRGLLLWRSGRLNDEELIRMVDEVRQSGRADWKNDFLLGQVHFERGDCEEAIHVLGAMPADDFCRQEVRDALSAAMETISLSRKLLHTFKGHRNAVTSVCLSADGCYALSGSGTQFAFSKEKDFTLRMWDIRAEACLRTFEGHTGRVTSVCFSRDGALALSGSADMTLRLWNAAEGRCLRIFTGHAGSVNAVCLTPDARYALSAGRDTTLKLWDAASGMCLRTLEGHDAQVTSVCDTHDGRQFISGSADTTVKVWDAASGMCLRTFAGHRAGVTSVSVCSDGRLVLSGSDDTTLKLWQADTGLCLRTFRGHEEKISSVCLSPDGRYAVSGGGDFLGKERAVKLWEVSSGRCLYTFKGHSGNVHSVCFSQDGRYALSGSQDMTLMLWQAALDAKPYSAPLMLSTLQDSSETVLAQIEYARHVHEARKALEQHAAVEAARQVRLARAQKGYSRSREALGVWADLYVRLPKKGLSGWWNEGMLTGHTDAVSTACISADGTLCVSGSEDATLKLWETNTGACLHTCEGHRGAVYSACMTADMQHILSGSGDADILLWSAAGGRCLQAFKGHARSVFSVCLSPDDHYVYSGSEDATIRLWDI